MSPSVSNTLISNCWKLAELKLPVIGGYACPRPAARERTMGRLPFALLAMAALLLSSPVSRGDELPSTPDTRMAWWQDARFGMFIHWGVYAVPAGSYNGKPVRGLGEWIMNRGHIPVAEYKRYSAGFTATHYDPDSWVKLTSRAGMKYIVITAKHHDGFALFDSQASDWNVVKSSAAGRDLLAPLAASCRSNGVRLCFFYSQSQDWVNGGTEAGGSWDASQEGRDFDEYVGGVAVPQVRELLTKYGPGVPAVLWWDTPLGMTHERAQKFADVVEQLRPGLIQNNRLGGGFKGDIETPEQRIPETGLPGVDWETCMTMNDTWGYKSDDNNWKSSTTLIHNLIEVVSKGGNYLLNVGPRADGTFPPPAVDRLEAIGKWMEINGEAIHGTTASPFDHLLWGRCTKKARADGGTLYLHVFNWPGDGILVLPGLRNKIASATLLAGGAKLEVTRKGREPAISLPKAMPDSDASVVRVDYEGALSVGEVYVEPDARGVIVLSAGDAVIQNKPDGHARLDGKPPYISRWVKPSTTLQWGIAVPDAGDYGVSAEYACSEASAFAIVVGTNTLAVTAAPTGGDGQFASKPIFSLHLEKGDQTIQLIPDAAKWRPVNLRSLVLTASK